MSSIWDGNLLLWAKHTLACRISQVQSLVSQVGKNSLPENPKLLSFGIGSTNLENGRQFHMFRCLLTNLFFVVFGPSDVMEFCTWGSFQSFVEHSALCWWGNPVQIICLKHGWNALSSDSLSAATEAPSRGTLSSSHKKQQQLTLYFRFNSYCK